MAQSSYDKALNEMLASEGGYSNDPGDPGGPTKYGVTIYDVRRFIKANATAADVKALTLDQAKKIYKSKYWDAVSGDDLPPGVDYSIFDYAVNSGVGRAPKVLQHILGVHADGVIGPLTIAAAHAADPVKLVNQINDERLNFLHHLGTWRLFGRGWATRVAKVKRISQQLAKTAQPYDDSHNH